MAAHHDYLALHAGTQALPFVLGDPHALVTISSKACSCWHRQPGRSKLVKLVSKHTSSGNVTFAGPAIAFVVQQHALPAGAEHGGGAATALSQGPQADAEVSADYRAPLLGSASDAAQSDRKCGEVEGQHEGTVEVVGCISSLATRVINHQVEDYGVAPLAYISEKL